jgi:hypothetical protein
VGDAVLEQDLAHRLGVPCRHAAQGTEEPHRRNRFPALFTAIVFGCRESASRRLTWSCRAWASEALVVGALISIGFPFRLTGSRPPYR